MSKQFPKPFNSHFGDSLKVKIDLSNYAKKTDIKNILHVDTSIFALKTNLASLKTEVDKLDIDKLAPVPVDLSKLSDAVKKDVVKKTEYDQLVGKVNNIDTSDFVLKTKYNTGKTKLENKIPNISNLATKTALTTVENKIPSVSDSVKKRDYNNKVTEIEKKIPDISNLATKTALATIENKIPSASDLVKKTDHNTKVIEIENKLNNHIMINILILQSLILQLPIFSMREQHKPI